jgi:hypothetical protein
MLGNPSDRTRPLSQQRLVGGAENRLLVVHVADEQALFNQGLHQYAFVFRGQRRPGHAAATHRILGGAGRDDQGEDARQRYLRPAGQSAQDRFRTVADGPVNPAQRPVRRDRQLPPRATLQIELLQGILQQWQGVRAVGCAIAQQIVERLTGAGGYAEAKAGNRGRQPDHLSNFRPVRRRQVEMATCRLGRHENRFLSQFGIEIVPAGGNHDEAAAPREPVEPRQEQVSLRRAGAAEQRFQPVHEQNELIAGLAAPVLPEPLPDRIAFFCQASTEAFRALSDEKRRAIQV